VLTSLFFSFDLEKLVTDNKALEQVNGNHATHTKDADRVTDTAGKNTTGTATA
jgi:hypothetical protein